MTAERFQQLIAGYAAIPTPEQLAMLMRHFELLGKWKAKTNLTAIREPEEMVRRHFGESLALAQELSDLDHETVADLGSGAGFPGVPIAVMLPRAKVVLIESQNKKATFLKEVVRSLGLPNVSVLNQRAEEVSAKFEVVSLRAVERFTQALMVASLMLRAGGSIAVLVSAQQAVEVKAVLAHRGFRWRDKDLPGNARTMIGSS